MTRHFLLALALAAFLPGDIQAQTVPATPSPHLREADFSLTTSIFDRLRGQATRGGATSGTTQRAATPAPRFVGAIRFESGITGFVELFSASQTSVQAVHVGDALPWEQTRILGISLDALHVTSPRGTRMIPMGYDFNNQPIQAYPPAGLPAPAPRDQRLQRRLFQPDRAGLPLAPGTFDGAADRVRERRRPQESGL